jgi:cyclic pyranopterin phosphate synthase
MPAAGLTWQPRSEQLTVREIERVAGILVRCGVRSIKVTGGEPLVRHDCIDVVCALRKIDRRLDISLTTNGVLLERSAEALARAGLDRVTISCDSLLRHRFAQITLRDALESVLAGARASAAAGLTPVKVNVVVMRGVNDDEVVDFARLARDTGYDVRFIEYMPLDADERWSRDAVVSGEEIVEAIDEVFELVGNDDGDAPATTWHFADGSPGTVGVIPSVTAPFCDSCDRLRLTADGQLRACLFTLDEVDLRTLLRSDASDDELETRIRECVAQKWRGHRIGEDDFVRPSRSMSMIGG